MLGVAVLAYRDDTCRIQREFVGLVERDALWCTVDIYSLHRAMTLYYTFTCMVVCIAAGLAVIGQYHQAVVFIPIEFSCLTCGVVLYKDGVTVRIVAYVSKNSFYFPTKVQHLYWLYKFVGAISYHKP